MLRLSGGRPFTELLDHVVELGVPITFSEPQDQVPSSFHDFTCLITVVVMPISQMRNRRRRHQLKVNIAGEWRMQSAQHLNPGSLASVSG